MPKALAAGSAIIIAVLKSRSDTVGAVNQGVSLAASFFYAILREVLLMPGRTDTGLIAMRKGLVPVQEEDSVRRRVWQRTANIGIVEVGREAPGRARTIAGSPSST